jgi:glycosyltransferase involved in cell wall biosynthesis
MACGTPVIGTNVGGIRFSIKDGVTGSLVPPRQPKKLAQKIQDIISDQGKLSRMALSAVKHVNTWFTWAKVAEQVNELYEHVLSKGGKQANKLINIGDSRAA